MQSRRNICAYTRLITFSAAALFLLFSPVANGEPDLHRSKQVVRRGGIMGLDPGISIRVDESNIPVYARLDLRIGGGITDWLQLGLDWRMDLWVGGDNTRFERRYEIGPVLTFFLVKGWFARVFTHLGGYDPWFLTSGGQTGYEFSTGRFTGIGFALGGDADIPLESEARTAYSFSAVLFLTAYDLGNRRSRD